jgi:hypothetical protein
MGFNCKLAGYDTALEMVKAFAISEANQLEGVIEFIKTAGLDDELRGMEKAKDRKTLLALATRFARGYNGEKYYVNQYHIRLVDSLLWWRKIPDTPWTPEHAEEEEVESQTSFEATAPLPAPDDPPDMSKSTTVWTSIGAAATTIGTVLNSLKDLDTVVAIMLIVAAVGFAAWIIKERHKKAKIYGV